MGPALVLQTQISNLAVPIKNRITVPVESWIEGQLSSLLIEPQVRGLRSEVRGQKSEVRGPAQVQAFRQWFCRL